ncbi:hypothetical protein CPB84DRAFT_1659965, partial [Gymnopilus junonius]
LLSSSRGRAALLTGGLLSRLAKEHIGIDSACFGPSSAVTEHHLGCHFMADDGTVYWDDMLTEEEMDVICGFHMCYTGSAPNQVVHKSWWPKPAQWKNQKANGYNFGHWTEWDEVWYQSRLSEIEKGNAQPETPEFWRNSL